MAKFYTMVARCGDPKGPANNMKYTLIGSDFSTVTMTGNTLAKRINDGTIEVTNMGVTVKGLVSTNGAISKYTTFDAAGNLVGPPRCVVLNRVETNGKLSGYVMFTDNGLVEPVSITKAVALASVQLIANGKIKHTDAGDIVSSINGLYPLVESMAMAEPVGTSTIKFIFFGSAIKSGKKIAYAGAVTSAKDSKVVSRQHKEFCEKNEALISELKGTFNLDDKAVESMKIRQYPGAAFYGVYKMPEIPVKNCTVSVGQNNVIVGCIDCDAAEYTESMVQVNVSTGNITEVQEGSQASDKAVVTYANQVLKMLKKVKK